MATPVPIRDLGKYGIIKDLAPFDLPIGAWSDGSNVLFQNNRITTGPTLRNITNIASVDSLPEAPVFVATAETAAGFDPIILATKDFRFRSLVNDLLTNIDPVTPSAVTDERYTSTNLGGVLYINRPDQVPHYYDANAPQMKPLPAWNSGWRCRAFRGFKDFAIALSVTKASIDYPTMVKWSNATLSGSTPPDWDELNLASLAGENILTEASGQLVDGREMKNDFIIYSNREVFLMEYIGAPFVFQFRKLFSDDGVMAPNCVVDVLGQHFVFGQRDIYVHDGMSKKSLADNRVRRYIYDRISKVSSKFCFTFHSPHLTSVFFCYPTNIGEVFFGGAPYCTEAAVYNYSNDTWSFMDMPNVTSATMANVDSKITYDTAGTTSYADVGGSFAEQEDSFTRHVILSSVRHGNIAQSRILGMDDPTLSKIARPLVPELMAPSFVTRTGLSFDALGHTLDARKLTTTMYPLVQMEDGTPFSVAFGRSDFVDLPPTQETALWFNPRNQYKVDTRNTGRFVSMKFNFTPAKRTALSGFDLDIRRISGR
jgi:hypothetical protein